MNILRTRNAANYATLLVATRLLLQQNIILLHNNIKLKPALVSYTQVFTYDFNTVLK